MTERSGRIGLALAALVILPLALLDASRLVGEARVGALSNGVVARDPLLRGIEELRPYDRVQDLRCCGDAGFGSFSLAPDRDVRPPVEVRVVRAGERFVRALAPEDWTVARLVVALGPPLAVGALLVIAAVALLSYSTAPGVTPAALLTGVLGLQLLTAFDANWTHRFERLHVAGLSLVPALLLHVTLLFPRRTRLLAENPGFLSPLYGIAAIAIVLEQALFESYPERWILFSRIRELSTLLIGAVLLLRTFQALGQAADPAERYRARILTYGMAFAFGVPVLAFAIDLAAPSNLFGAVTPFSAAAVPISLGLAVARSDLLGLDDRYRRLLVPSGITAISIVLLFLVQLGAFRAAGVERPLESPAFAIAFVAVLALALEAMRRLATAGIEQWAPSAERRYRSFLSGAAARDPIALGARETTRFVCSWVHEELQPRFAAFLAPDAEDRLRTACAVGEVPAELATLDLSMQADAATRLFAARSYLAGPDLDAAAREAWTTAGLGDIEVALPIRIRGAPAGALVLGSRALAYAPADLELLDLLAQSAALALQQARHVEQLEADLRSRSSDLARTLEHVRVSGGAPPLLTDDETRFAWVGKLASGVAHEANKPLYVVEHHLERLRREGHADASRLRAIAVEVARVRRLIGDLQAYGHSHSGDVRRVEVGILLEDALSETSAGLRVELDGDLRARVRVDPALGERVLSALLQNAAEAKATGVRVCVAADAERVRIGIEDNGPGVPEEIRDQIFEPFMSTHHVESATGLGLAIAREIARAHGGSLDLVPSNRGARFELVLPAE